MIPPIVTNYLDTVSGRVSSVLGEQLIGICTTGSLALGDFRPNRSDIDLMVITDGPVPPSRLLHLADVLDHRVIPCPAAGLELVVYPHSITRASTLTSGYLLNLNTGPALPNARSLTARDTPGFWFAIDRDVTHQAGRALIGPSTRELVAPIPFEWLLPVVLESVEAHASAIDSHLLDNAVLNACRAWTFAEDRRWQAKLPAARDLLPRAREFADLIRATMTSFERGRASTQEIAIAEVSGFLTHVLDQLNSHDLASASERDP